MNKMFATRAFPVAVLFGLWACVSGLSFPGLAEESRPRQPESLNGIWTSHLSETQVFQLKIDAAKIESAVLAGNERIPVWSGKLVLSKDHPQSQMDWVELNAAGRNLPDNKCLYRLRGDTLLVIGGGPKDRPTRFFSGPGGEPKTLILTREAEKTL